jgi:hypothetical protein
MFLYNHHHQGAYCMSLLKLLLLKQSIKKHWCCYQVPAGVCLPQGPDNICSHTARLTTPMYFN